MDYRPELRRAAHEAMKEHGSLRAAAKALGISPKRVHELNREYDEGKR